MSTAVPALIGMGISAVSNFLGKKSQSNSAMQMNKQTFEYNKKLNKQTSKLDYKNAIKLMRQENAYNTAYMSNSAKATEGLNKNLMDYQYALERESRQSAFQDTRKDLESAGYNPLLAVGQQSGYTSVGSGVSTQSEGMENSNIATSAMDIMEKLANMRNSSRTVDLNEQNLWQSALNSKYENDLTSAKAEHERSLTRGQDISNNVDLITKLDQALENLNLTREERANLIQTRENLIQQNKNLVAEEGEIKSRTELNSAKTAETKENTKYVGYNAQTGRTNANANLHNAYKTKGTSKSTSRTYPGYSVKLPFGAGWSVTSKGYTDSYSH